MKPHNQDHNQGEGDRLSARRYNRDVRRFVADGKVDDAARDAKQYVEQHPSAAAGAEARARRGPHGRRGTAATVDELIAKGRTIVDRIKPVVERVTKRVRRRLHRK
jgi:hypothetical protein